MAAEANEARRTLLREFVARVVDQIEKNKK